MLKIAIGVLGLSSMKWSSEFAKNVTPLNKLEITFIDYFLCVFFSFFIGVFFFLCFDVIIIAFIFIAFIFQIAAFKLNVNVRTRLHRLNTNEQSTSKLYGKKDKTFKNNNKKSSPTSSEKQGAIDRFDAITRKFMVS